MWPWMKTANWGWEFNCEQCRRPLPPTHTHTTQPPLFQTLPLTPPDPWLRPGQTDGRWDDGIRGHTLVPSARDHVKLDALQPERWASFWNWNCLTYLDFLVSLFICGLSFYAVWNCELKCSSVSLPVDIWSVGCIMGELLKGKVLFPGTDCILYMHEKSLVRPQLFFTSRL